METSRKAKYLEYPRIYKSDWNIQGHTQILFRISKNFRWRHLEEYSNHVFKDWQKFCSDHLVPTNTWVVFAYMIGKVHQSVTSSITGNKRWVASGWWSKPTSVARDPPVVVEIHSSTSSRPVATRQQRLEDPTTFLRDGLELSQAENLNNELLP